MLVAVLGGGEHGCEHVKLRVTGPTLMYRTVLYCRVRRHSLLSRARCRRKGATPIRVAATPRRSGMRRLAWGALRDADADATATARD